MCLAMWIGISAAGRAVQPTPTDCSQVALAALGLANAFVAGDAMLLEAACLLGLLPAVTRYAFAVWPLPLRVQAAQFVHALCFAGEASARMLVACQVSAPAPPLWLCMRGPALAARAPLPGCRS